MTDIQCLQLPVAAMGSGVIDAFRMSNMAGKVIVIMHVFGSIIAWSVMITKWKELKSARAANQRFLTDYRSGTEPLALWSEHRRFAEAPMYTVYERACATMQKIRDEADFSPHVAAAADDAPGRWLRERDVGQVRNLAEGSVGEIALQLEKGMTMLAMAVSAAPTLGLLGTVWGVMEAFGVMTSSGSAMLSAVAPGISGALLTTVTGLLVALPSVVVYNLLTDTIRGLTVRTENFQQELVADIERHYRHTA